MSSFFDPVGVRRVVTRCDLEEAFAIRHEVFVDEQGVAVEEEVDGADASPTTVHVLAEVGGAVVGTARLLTDPAHPGVVHIGRVAVRREARGGGVGAAIMRGLEGIALAEFAADDGARPARARSVRIELSAQESAIPFYTALGYSVSERRYLDAGIWHRDAVKVLAEGPAGASAEPT